MGRNQIMSGLFVACNKEDLIRKVITFESKRVEPVVFCKQMCALVHALNWQVVSVVQIKSYVTALASCRAQNKSNFSGTSCQVYDVVTWHLGRIFCPKHILFLPEEKNKFG